MLVLMLARSPALWWHLALLLIAMVLGLWSAMMSWLGLLWFLAIGGLFYVGYRMPVGVVLRSSARVGAFLLACAAGFKVLPGFEDHVVVRGEVLSPDSAEVWVSFKWFQVGFASLLCMIAPLTFARTVSHWRANAKWLVAGTIFSVTVMPLLAISFGYVRWDPKWPSFALVWMIHNLFFVSFFEEVFFRGFLQDGLEGFLARFTTYAAQWSLGVVGLLFGLAHFRGGWLYVVFATIAGLVYGLVYQRCRSIEAPILVHFVLNLNHFLLYSYPALAGSI